MNYKALQDASRVVLRQIEEIRQKNKDVEAKSWSANDVTTYENLAVELETLEKQMETAQKVEATEKRLSTPLPFHIASPTEPADETKALDDAYSARFMKALLEGRMSYEDEVASNAYRKAHQLDNPAGGGYLVTPMQLVNDLIVAIKNNTYVMDLATVYTLNGADSLGVPSLETDIDDATWSSELATVTETADVGFGRRELRPNRLNKLVKISRTLMRTATNAEGILLDRLGYKFAVTIEKACITGTGAGQPLGLFTASAEGIPTTQDSTAANSTSIVGDDFIETKHSLKAAYWDRASWLLHRDVLKAARKLKDTTNNYIWSTGFGPGLGFQGNAPTLLDRPYYISEYAPNTFTTGLYMAVFGDFSKYWMAQRFGFEVQVLNELYAATDQIGYKATQFIDGAPVLSEAFRRLKLA